MAGKKMHEFDTVLKTDPLTLTCEWQYCQDVYDDVDAFCDHLEEHLRAFVPPDVPEDTSMTCEWQECGHEMSCILELVRHVYFHAFHVRLKCSGYTLILKNKWRGCRLDSASRNTVPDLPDRFHCAWTGCDGIFDNPDLFYKHVRAHGDSFPEGNHVPEGCKCQWNGCELTLKSKHKLKAHLRSHTQEKTVACPTCGSLFATSTRFLDHIKRQQDCDDSSQYYQCSYCNKRFPSERILKDHMRHHVNHYKCPFCEMTCPSPSNLKMHIDYKHSDGKAHKCASCDFRAKTINDIRRHTERMHARSLLKCEVEECNFRCRNLSEYKHHYRIAHEGHDKPYLCHVCGEHFKRGTRLTTHLKRKHKFKWLPGHSRFRFKQHEDGYYRLQTVRYESVEITPEDSSSPNQHPSYNNSAHNNASTAESTIHDPGSKAVSKRKTLKPSKRKSPSGQTKKTISVADDNNDEGDPDIAITMVSKGKSRKRKKPNPAADLSYNLEMLGDVALNLSRDSEDGDAAGHGIVKLQRMAEGDSDWGTPPQAEPRKAANDCSRTRASTRRNKSTTSKKSRRKTVPRPKNEPFQSMPSGGELLCALEGTNGLSVSASPRKLSRSPNKKNIWKNFGQSSTLLDPPPPPPPPNSGTGSSVGHANQAALDLSQTGGATATNPTTDTVCRSEPPEHGDDGTVVANFVDASGQMVYVTSNIPVSFADAVQVIAPLDS